MSPQQPLQLHDAKGCDVVIVGAGPASLSSALILGRCRRRVLVCDRGTPRSWASHAIHGYLARDGVHPDDFRAEVSLELARYPTVRMRKIGVSGARKVGDNFSVVLDNGE